MNKTSVSTFPTIIQHSSGSPSYSNKRKNKIKVTQTGKEVKFSLFADDKVLYMENPKDIFRKLLEIMSEFSKVTDTKSKHRNHLHFYILTMKKSEREIIESIPFTIATKIIKYLGRNLPKEAKELYTENCNTLMKEIKNMT